MATILIGKPTPETRGGAAPDPLLASAVGALREPVRQFVREAAATANFWDWIGDEFGMLEPLRVYAGGDVGKAATLLETMIRGEFTARDYRAA